jgi:hypothetical protein
MSKQTTPISSISWITGNITPATWYYKILKPSGIPDFVSIAILADVINWYQPTKEGKQKFKADKLQRDYQAYSKMLNTPKLTIKKSFDYLEAYGLITREFRTVETASGKILNNVMYISPMFDNIKSITMDTVTKNSPPPQTDRESPPQTDRESPPQTDRESPPQTDRDIYGKNGNNHVSKNDDNCDAQNFGQEELSPAVVSKTLKVNNVETSQTKETLSLAEYNKRKFNAVIVLIPEKYKEPFVLSYLKKNIAEEDYTEEYYKNAIIYTNDHARGSTKQYRSYLGQAIDKQWAVNYVSKNAKAIKEKEDNQKALEEKRNMPTSVLLDEARKGCLVATQILNERPIEQLTKEYEENHCQAAKFVLIKRKVLPKPEEEPPPKPNKEIIINNFTMPALKTDSEKKANLERQKRELREMGLLL